MARPGEISGGKAAGIVALLVAGYLVVWALVAGAATGAVLLALHLAGVI